MLITLIGLSIPLESNDTIQTRTWLIIVSPNAIYAS
jgi:hypothetical protein